MSTKFVLLCSFSTIILLIIHLQLRVTGEQSNLRTANKERADCVIYVLDSGVRATHISFRNTNIFPGARIFPMNEILNESSDENGHGTFVTSLLTSEQRLTIIPLIIVSNNGKGEEWAIVEAVKFAIEHKNRHFPDKNAAILLCSSQLQKKSYREFPYNFFQYPLEAGLELAHQNGFVTILSAGNHNTNACYLRIPSSTIIVGACNENRTRSSFSNYGKCIHIFATGRHIGASNLDDVSFTEMQGTSVAAPQVMGSFVQYWLKNPDKLNCNVVYDFLFSSNHVQNEYITNMNCLFTEEPHSCEDTTRKGLV